MQTTALFWLTNAEGQTAIPLVGRRVIVGRAPSCDIVIDSPTVSAFHCKLKYVAGAWVVTDLQSSNGTYVNGLKVQRQSLMIGDVIGLGRQVTLRLTHQVEMIDTEQTLSFVPSAIPGTSRPLHASYGDFQSDDCLALAW